MIIVDSAGQATLPESKRVHRLTHPTYGPISWRELQAKLEEIRKTRRVCSWCLAPVPKGNRTRCSSRVCHEAIWQLRSWPHCSDLCLRRDRQCKLCGSPAQEADHIIPVSLGGTGDQSNLRGLCHACHNEETQRLRRMKRAYIPRNRETHQKAQDQPGKKKFKRAMVHPAVVPGGSYRLRPIAIKK